MKRRWLLKGAQELLQHAILTKNPLLKNYAKSQVKRWSEEIFSGNQLTERRR